MTKELHCPECKEPHTIKKGQCKHCDYIFKKSVAEFYNLTLVKPKPPPKKEPVSEKKPEIKEEQTLEDIYCPGCGLKHVSNNRYCLNCKTDMEPIILEFKDKNLPLSFNNLQKDPKEHPIRRGSNGGVRRRRIHTESNACCDTCNFIDLILTLFSGC